MILYKKIIVTLRLRLEYYNAIYDLINLVVFIYLQKNERNVEFNSSNRFIFHKRLKDTTIKIIL